MALGNWLSHVIYMQSGLDANSQQCDYSMSECDCIMCDCVVLCVTVLYYVTVLYCVTVLCVIKIRMCFIHDMSNFTVPYLVTYTIQQYD